MSQDKRATLEDMYKAAGEMLDAFLDGARGVGLADNHVLGILISTAADLAVACNFDRTTFLMAVNDAYNLHADLHTPNGFNPEVAAKGEGNN